MAWKIEAKINGDWLWIIMPNYPSKEQAEEAAKAMNERETIKLKYRIVEA
jgi:hypothetical protein